MIKAIWMLVLGYLTRVGAWISQGINCVCLGGHPDQTVSARAWLNRGSAGWRSAYRVINGVFFWQADHCRASHASDVEFAERIAKLEIAGEA